MGNKGLKAPFDVRSRFDVIRRVRRSSGWGRFIALGLLLAGLGVAGLPAFGVNACDVTVGAGQTYTTIQSGIDAASSGQTVCVLAGTYIESPTISNKAVTLQGAKAGVAAGPSSSPVGRDVDSTGGYTGESVIKGTLAVSGASTSGTVIDGLVVETTGTSILIWQQGGSTIVMNSVLTGQTLQTSIDGGTTAAIVKQSTNAAYAYEFHNNWIKGGRYGMNFNEDKDGTTYVIDHNYFTGAQRAIQTQGSSVGVYTITNNLIEGTNVGIRLARDGATISGNTIRNLVGSDTTQSAVTVDINVTAVPAYSLISQSRGLTITNNYISNSDYGIFLNRPMSSKTYTVSSNRFGPYNVKSLYLYLPGAGTVVTATNDYWGQPTGPSVTQNAPGAGATITTGPWIYSYTDDPAYTGLPGFWPTSIATDQPCTTTCFVNAATGDDSYSGTALGPFKTIQKGIDSVSAGGTVNVASGTYATDVSVNKRITLQGSGSSAAGTVVQGTVAISGSGANASSRTVVRDIRITGSSGDGVSIAAGTSYVTVSGVASVSNAQDGVELLGGALTSDILLTGMTINDNGTGSSGTGIRMGALANVDGLTIANSQVKRNNAGGFSYNPSGETATALTNVLISNSVFEHNGDATYSGSQLGSGDISFYRFNGNATLRGVTVTGLSSAGAHIGIQFRGSSTPAPSGTVLLEDVAVSGGYFRPAAAAVSPGAPGYGIAISDYSSVTNLTLRGVSVNTTYGHGLYAFGLSSTLDLGNSSITASHIGSGAIVLDLSGAIRTNVDATDATIAGVATSTGTTAQMLTVSDEVFDRIDYSPLGMVRLRDKQVYVTTNSGAPFQGYPDFGPSIQIAVDAADAGDTVTVGPGTFTGNVATSKALTLLGAKAGVAAGPSASPASRSTSSPYTGETVISGELRVNAVSGVTIDGFVLKKDASPAYLSGSLSTIIRNNIIVANDGAAMNGTTYGIEKTTSSSDGAYVVQSNRFVGGTVGIHLAGDTLGSSWMVNGNYFSEMNVGIETTSAMNAAAIYSNNRIATITHGIRLAEAYAGIVIQSNSIEVSVPSGGGVAAIECGSYGENCAALEVLGNVIDAPTGGYGIYAAYASGTLNRFVGNRFTGSGTYVNLAAAVPVTVIDATGNEWNNSGLGPDVVKVVADGQTVTTSPYISSFTLDGSRSGDPGFWPLTTTLAATSGGGTVTASVANPDLDSPTISFPLNGDATVVVTEGTNPVPGNTPFAVTGSTALVDIEVNGVGGATSGPYLVCLTGAAPKSLWHYESGAWVDMTWRDLAGGVNPLIPSNYPGQLCGETATLSPVVVASNAATTTTITGTALGTSTAVGIAYTVSGTVSVDTADKPAGNLPDQVEVNDGLASCTDTTLTAGAEGGGTSSYEFSCSLTSTTAGSKTLTATFSDSGGAYLGSSDTDSHVVDAATTATAITAESADPTVIGEAYTVSGTVSVTTGNGPGSGTLPGSVTVSDGTDSCTDSSVTYSSTNVYAFSCSLTSGTGGAKTLTATYTDPAPTDFTGSSGTASHTVNAPTTSTTVTSDLPDPSVVGQSYTASGSVTIESPGNGPSSGEIPGSVTVSDGTDSCTDSTVTFSAANTYAYSCSLSSTTAGTKTLTATFTDSSATYAGSSGTTSHTVNAASTTTAIGSDTPDPSVSGSAYTVSGTVSVTGSGNGPGSGNLPGSVTVSDATDSCTDTSVAYSSANTYAFSCSLTSTTAGSKTLTATYSDPAPADFSTSSDTAAHAVKAATGTTITSDSPDPSDVGEAYTVAGVVSVTSPNNGPGGGGPLPGTVTVSDGTLECSDGSLSLSGTPNTYAFTCDISGTATAGSRTLTATYADSGSDYAGSSDTESHSVDAAGTSTTITGTSLGTATVVGESYTVSGTVAVDSPGNGPGSGDLPGSVTVSDGSATCSDTSVAYSSANTFEFSCSLTSRTAATKTLTATYADPAPTDFAGSSDTDSHVVDAADTTTTITSDSPDPSVALDAYTVSGTVVVESPGSGPSQSPTATNLPGEVTVGDGTDDCSDTTLTPTVTANTFAFSCSLTSTTPGTKTLTATYSDPAPEDFTGSSDEESHSVNAISTSTIYTGQTYDADLGPDSTLSVSVAVADAACFTNATVVATLTPAAAGSPYTLLDTTGSGSTRAFSKSVPLSAGLYEIDIDFTPPVACAESSADDAVLTVVGAGETANGGGWYKLDKTGLPGSPRVNFGFNITKSTRRSGGTTITDYRGHLLWINNGQWRIVGTVYSTGSPYAYGTFMCPGVVGTATDRKCASFAGSGLLQMWDGDSWEPSTYGTVTFTVTVYDGGTSKVCTSSGKKCTTVQNPDYFGIQFDPVPSSAIRESAPIVLSGGSIRAG